MPWLVIPEVSRVSTGHTPVSVSLMITERFFSFGIFLFKDCYSPRDLISLSVCYFSNGQWIDIVITFDY